MTRGRIKFNNAKELDKAINNYFDKCDKKNKPYTVSGLALALDTSVKVLRDYRDCEELDSVLKTLDKSVKEEISSSVKRAYLRCENYVEEKMLDPNIDKSPTGYIFAAKNFGWVDKQEIENSGSTTQKIELSGLSTEEIKKLLEEEK